MSVRKGSVRVGHKVRVDRNMAARLSESAEELLGAVVEYLIQAGVSRSRASVALDRVQSRLSSRRQVVAWRAGTSAFVHRLSAAYEAWWTNPAYVDESGKPLPLPLRAPGQRPSILRLLRTEFDAHELPEAVRTLRASPSVKVTKGSKWLARDAALILVPDGELSFGRAVGLVKGLLSTIHFNNTERVPSRGLFDRTVMSVNVPKRLIPALKREIHEHCGQAIFALQKLIQNAEHRPGRRSGTEFGIEMFAYELPVWRDGRSSSKGRAKRTARRPQ